eukprot:tig00021293_g20018.t1
MAAELLLGALIGRFASKVFENAVLPLLARDQPQRPLRRAIGMLRQDGAFILAGAADAILKEADPSGSSARLFELACPEGGLYLPRAGRHVVALRSLVTGELLAARPCGAALELVPAVGEGTVWVFEEGTLRSASGPQIALDFVPAAAVSEGELDALRRQVERLRREAEHEFEARIQSEGKARAAAGRLEEALAEAEALDAALEAAQAAQREAREELAALRHRVAMAEAKRHGSSRSLHGRGPLSQHSSSFAGLSQHSASSVGGLAAAAAEGDGGITSALFDAKRALGYRIFSASATGSPATSGRATPEPMPLVPPASPPPLGLSPRLAPLAETRFPLAAK